jgi:hypothetical protein
MGRQLYRQTDRRRNGEIDRWTEKYIDTYIQTEGIRDGLTYR